jgi:hypothetical protein
VSFWRLAAFDWRAAIDVEREHFEQGWHRLDTLGRENR